MDIPQSGDGPVLEVDAGSSRRKFVVLRGAVKCIRWIIRAVFGHKVYFFCLAVVLALVIVMWDIPYYYEFSVLYITPSDWCKKENIAVIEGYDQLEMANSAAASTLMTFLPALLAFSPFPTARISSLIIFSTSAAILTSAFTLGLATSNISTQPRNRIFSVIRLCTNATIKSYANVGDPGRALDHLYLPRGDLAGHNSHTDLVPQFQLSIAGAFHGAQSFNTLRDIMLKAVFENRRATRIRLSVMEVGFFLIQSSLLYLLLTSIPNLNRMSLFWMCVDDSQYFLVMWMFLMAVITGLIRTFAESSTNSNTEILHIRPLPPSFQFEPCDKCSSANIQSPHRVTAPITDFQPRNESTIYRYLMLDAPLASRLRYVQYLRHGMVVVLRPSELVDGQLSTTRFLHRVLIGFLQALILIFLTVLFASTYDGDILVVASFVVAFLAVTVISRTYSIYFCSWMERALDTIQIEYDTPAELRAIRTIIAGMPSVSVHNVTKKRIYFAGNRMDHSRDCENHTHHCTTHRQGGYRYFIILSCGILLTTIMFSIYTAALGPVYIERYMVGYVTWTYNILQIVMANGLIAGKLLSDFDFIVTHWDTIQVPPEVVAYCEQKWGTKLNK